MRRQGGSPNCPQRPAIDPEQSAGRQGSGCVTSTAPLEPNAANSVAADAEAAQYVSTAGQALVCAQCDSRAQRMQRCARCKRVWYCSRSCQADAWLAGHRAVCQVDSVPLDAGLPSASPAGGDSNLPPALSADSLTGPDASQHMPSTSVRAKTAAPANPASQDHPRAAEACTSSATEAGRSEGESTDAIALVVSGGDLEGGVGSEHRGHVQPSGGGSNQVASRGESQAPASELSARGGKGFNITCPPEGYDDPDLVVGMRKNGDDMRGASSTSPEGYEGYEGYDDPDHVVSINASERSGSAYPMSDGHNDPDLIVGARAGCSSGAHGHDGALLQDRAIAPQRDVGLQASEASGAEDEMQGYTGLRADAAPVVADAARVLDREFMKAAETLASERALLEEETASHRRLLQAILSAQVRCLFCLHSSLSRRGRLSDAPGLQSSMLDSSRDRVA